MQRTCRVSCWAGFAVFVAVLWVVWPALAGSVSIDTFRDAPASVYIYPLVNPGAWSSAQSDASILGGERQVRVTPVGGTPPASSVKVVSAVGIDSGVVPDGALQIGTQGGYSAEVELIYDGVGSQGLGGFDFTQGGTNDRLTFSFAWIASVGSLDATMTITDTQGRQVSQNVVWPDNGSPHLRHALFSNFSGDAGTALDSVDKLEIVFNSLAVPNTDFALQSISIVPEPASWSLLAIGTLAFAVYRRRRRNHTTINP